MSILHTVNKSPFDKNSLSRCIDYAQADSAILLIEDGVYGAMKGTNVADQVAGLDGVSVYILGPDMQARGINEDALLPGISVVDYAGFVDLVTEKDKVQSWL